MKRHLISLTVFTGIIAGLALLSSCAKEPAANVSGTQTASVTITQETQATEEPAEQLLGGDRDEHGCIGSAGYSWCEAKQKCLRPWEEECAATTVEPGSTTTDPTTEPVDPTLEPATPVVIDTNADITALKEAFSEKYDKPVSEINLTNTQITSNFARGGVSFGAEPGAGGMFMAVKRDGEWILAFDGNGAADCNSLEEYGFPSAMLEGICY